MMKQRPSGAGGKPTRFCKFLLLAAALKLGLLGLVLAEPFMASVPAFWPSAAHLTVKSGDDPVPQAGTVSAMGMTGAAFAAAAEAPRAPAGQAGQGSAAAQGGAPVNSLTLEAMNRRQEELSRKEQDLRALERGINDRLEQMQGLEMRLQTMLKDAEETRSGKYRHLVDVLSNMKSRQAAEVLETLDEKIAVKVLAGMRGRQAGEILTYSTPAKAARLSESLARIQMPLE